MSDIIRRKKGWILGITICIGGFLIALPNLPWIRPEIIEDGEIVKIYDDGSCVVETKTKFILNVWNCKEYNLGDEVQIKYRKDTSLADIITKK
ncbi:MAG: hypothetical protein QW416_05775 [Candidatus Nitrosocaldaceae archaeon]